MTVHIIILIFSLSVYGFAPYGFDVLTERALVQQSNLAVEVQERNVTRNVWGGPPQVYHMLYSVTVFEFIGSISYIRSYIWSLYES